MKLYHGGHEEITAPNERGLFCSAEQQTAASHGPMISTFDLDESDILTNFTLNYEIDAIDAIERVLREELPEGADIDRAWEVVVESAGCVGADDELDLFGEDHPSEAAWEAQRIRGRVAFALGYRAVEMLDEHGTSYLLVR